MSDCEDFSGSRPYECVSCGTRMRTRGIDGRCIACFAAPPVRCERCARVRFDPDTAWEDHPGKLPGEVAGECKTCGDLRAEKWRKAAVRESRRLLRDRAKGYGPAPEGVNIFKGMRGE